MTATMLVATLRTALAIVLLCGAAVARSGGGPETTLLVVNARSPLSLAVANDYIGLRDLPEGHVLWLDDVPPVDTIDVKTFRARVLAPILRYLESSGLGEEIDLIAYSAGFPYAVNFRGDEIAQGLARDRYRGDTASLTGMTYFARQVEAGQVAYLGREANRYFRRPLAPPVAPSATAPSGDAAAAAARQPVPITFEGAIGFRSRHRWDRGARPAAAADHRYFLSVMLGYAGLRGNSLAEIANYLARAAASDGTHPHGTVYLMDNPNIRSQVRRPLFPATMAALELRGRRAEILVRGEDGQNGREPRDKRDIIGLVAGTPVFDWDADGSRLLPGAIAESFTSYGADFARSAQTKLSEFLRHGAAGSSGAVREPYSFADKFPVPQLHVHYADGSSLAEAFYQSVLAPYQLLIVGDPLARPFAHFATVSLAAPGTRTTWRGPVDIEPRVVAAAGRPIGRVELWVDGRLHRDAPPGQTIALDTTRLGDGVHELRLVAVEAGAIETRSYAKALIRVDNRGRRVELADQRGEVAHGDWLALAGRADGATRVSLYQASRIVADAAVVDGHWRVEVASAQLGTGSVRLHAVAHYADGGTVRSAPFELRVTPPRLLPPIGPPPKELQGLELRSEHAGGASETMVVRGLGGALPADLRKRGAQRIVVGGAFEVREAGLFELTLETRGRVTVSVGDSWRHSADIGDGDEGLRVAVPLAAGWHRFELVLSDRRPMRLRALLAGPEPAFVLGGERVRRIAGEVR